MKKFSILLAAAAVAAGSVGASADTWSLVGAFNSWANADETTVFTDNGDGIYTLTGVSISAGGFKVIKDQAWDTQYGSNGSSLQIGVDYQLQSDGENIVFANATATYTSCTVILTISSSGATLNITGTETEGNIESWCLCGAFNSWDVANAPTFTSQGDGVFVLTMDGLYGEFGIYANNSWDVGLKSNSAGDYLTLNTSYELGQGSNLRFENTQTVYNGCTITLTVTSSASYLYITSTSQDTQADSYCLTGGFNSWSLEANPFTDNGDGTYTLTLDEFSGEFKVGVNGSWDNALGSNGNSFEGNASYTLTSGGDNVVTDGTYTGCTFTLTVSDSSVSILLTCDNDYYLSGELNSWSLSENPFTSAGDGVYTLTLDELSGTFKVTRNQTWTYQYGSSSTITAGESITLAQNGDDIAITDGSTISGCTLTLTVDSDGTLTLAAAGEVGGLSSVDADAVTVTATAGAIIVTGTTDVKVYNLSGMLVSTAAESQVTAGVYIVAADGTVQKVVVR